MNHHRAGKLLSAYLDGELTPADAAAVQEHLLDCAACRAAYEGLRAAKEALAQLPIAEPAAEFWRDVREPVGGAPAPEGVGRRLLGRPRLAWALAAILVVVALAAAPLVKGTIDRLHATEIGVDLYVREHGLQMSTEPFADRAYLGLITSDADLVLAGEAPRAGEDRR